MPASIVEQFAEFAHDSLTADLPDEVVVESERIVLDSLGCALAGGGVPMGRIGVRHGRLLGGSRQHATIIGTAGRTSIFGASFANAELINALDYDAVAPPGHVAPYAVP